MKLLLDQNLSYRLVAPLSFAFPDSTHVRHVGLLKADDDEVWEFARVHGFTIVSNDEDFHQLSFLHGHPPKVVWLRLGNSTTDQILATLRAHVQDIRDFGDDPDSAILIIS